MRFERFNVCHLHWPGPVDYFAGYREVVETVHHGLIRLGYSSVLSDEGVSSLITLPTDRSRLRIGRLRRRE